MIKTYKKYIRIYKLSVYLLGWINLIEEKQSKLINWKQIEINYYFFDIIL